MTTLLSDCDAPAGGFEGSDATLVIDDVAYSGSLGSVQLQSDGTSTRTIAALSATWTAPTNPYIVGVQFEYAPTSGDGETIRTSPQPPDVGVWKTTASIVGGAEYAVRYRAAGPSGLTFGPWSTPVNVTISQDVGPYNGDGVPTFTAPVGATYQRQDVSEQYRYTDTSTVDTLSITNPGFETGDMTGWTVSDVTVVAFTGMPTGDDTPHAGTYSAFAGTVTPTTFHQDFDVSASATDIDAGGVTIQGFGAYHTTYDPQTDHGRLEITFIDAVSATISQAVSTYSHPFVWTLETVAPAAVPVGTRTIRLGVQNIRDIGVNNDNYWDDFTSPTMVQGGWVLMADTFSVKDEGSTVASAVASIDFVGNALAATAAGAAVTVTLNTDTDGTLAANSDDKLATQKAVKTYVDAHATITAKDEGSTLTSAVTSVDFTGAGVTATNVGGAVTVAIPGGAAGAMTLLDSATPSGTATVTFNSISGAYKELRLVIFGRLSGAVTNSVVAITFNNDTGGNYDYQFTQSGGATATANPTAAGSSVGVVALPGASATSGVAGSAVLTIPSYANTTFQKSGHAQVSVKTGTATGNLFERSGSFWYRSASAISRIDLVAPSNFVAGTEVYLYGIA